MRKRFGLYLSGTEYCQNALARLVKENPFYKLSNKELIESDEYATGQFIGMYEITNYRATVKSEPDVWPQPGALSVYVGDLLIGYIPPKYVPELAEIADRPRLYMWAKVGYGDYKRILRREHDGKYYVEKKTGELGASFHVSWDAE